MQLDKYPAKFSWIYSSNCFFENKCNGSQISLLSFLLNSLVDDAV